MSKKKERKIDLNDLRLLEEACKLEIAEEIGVYDKVYGRGWRVLSAKESGRIGGILSKRKRARAKKQEARRTKTRNKQDRKHRPENRAYEV